MSRFSKEENVYWELNTCELGWSFLNLNLIEANDHSLQEK